MGGARRSDDRDQPDAEPRRLHRRQRHRPRSRRRRHGQVQGPGHQAGQRRIPLPGEGDDRGARALSRLRAAPGARRQERSVAGLAATAAHRDRAAADQCAGRYHQLHHLRPRPAAARVRCREGARRSHGAPRARRRDAARARRQDLHARRDNLRHRRRGRRGIAVRHHGRRENRLLGRDHGRAHRVGAVESDQHFPDRPQARHQFRCPLPLRARRRSGLHAARAGAGDADGARSLRRHAVGGYRRRQRGNPGAGHRFSVVRDQASGGRRGAACRTSAACSTVSALPWPARASA